MKGDIIRKALGVIKETGISMGDFATVILSEGYGASYSRLEKATDKRRNARAMRGAAADSRRAYSVLIYKLKKDGLVTEKSEKLYLTGKGQNKLEILKNKLQKKAYKTEAAGNFTIVAYDVPEAKNRERRWLREALGNMNLRMLQQSVWIGKVKLPKEFLEDLKNLDLLNCVEIFEITKSGTLREL